MKKEKKNRLSAAAAKIADAAMLPPGIAAGPYIQLCANRELTVEGLCRVTSYGDTEIRFFCGCTLITVGGKSLVILRLDDYALVIGGEITSLLFGN